MYNILLYIEIIVLIIAFIFIKFDLLEVIKINYFYYKMKRKKINIESYFNSEPIVVYRYEKDGIGVFTNKETGKKLYKKIIKTLNNKDHPSPLDDKKLRYVYAYLKKTKEINDYYFGCSSLEELRFWFNEDIRDIIEKKGFKIKSYKTNYYVKGTNQILFKKHK